jgi:hypothetical protein
MSPIAAPLRRLADRIAAASGRLGRRVELDLDGLTDRSGELDLQPPGLQSPNGSCRMVRAADGWIAVNLPRADDVELLPAWLGIEPAVEPWPAVEAAVRGRAWRELVADARELGLPVSGVGEVSAANAEAPLISTLNAPSVSALHAEPPPPLRGGGSELRVLDLSTLWAGPLCGAVLAAAGARVTKVESRRRPDPSRISTPGLFRRLNGGKADVALDFADAGDRSRLRDMMLAADVVITSARPRAFEQLGLAPAGVFAERPRLVWAAISGYGWGGEASDRVAFGDDAAAAGGLVRWTAGGEPHFLGDALADPLTGLAAAEGALRALEGGGGAVVDAALARCAAGAAAELGSCRAA